MYFRILDDSGHDPGQRTSDKEVVRLIDSYLEKAFSEGGDLSVGERYGRAFAFAVEDRQADSLDENHRDAERFLYGLAAGAQKDFINSALIATAPAYEAAKFVAEASGLERVMRTTDAPASKASLSAVDWAWKGLRQGLSTGGDVRIDIVCRKTSDMLKLRDADARDMQLRLIHD